MDEDNGQQQADQVTQDDMDRFYGNLADEMTRQRRIKNWIVAIVVMLIAIIVSYFLFYGGY